MGRVIRAQRNIHDQKANLMVEKVLLLRSLRSTPLQAHDVGALGVLARASGDYAIIISHNTDGGTSRIKLSSGTKKIVPSGCRAMIGQVAGGGRTDKPTFKAEIVYHKFRVKRNCWLKPKVCGVTLKSCAASEETRNETCERALSSSSFTGSCAFHIFGFVCS